MPQALLALKGMLVIMVQMERLVLRVILGQPGRQVTRVEDRMARATFLRRHIEGPAASDLPTPEPPDSALLEFLRGDTLLRFDSLAGDSR